MLLHFVWLDSLDLQNVHQDFVWHKAQGGHHDLKAWRRNEILRYKLIQDFQGFPMNFSPPKTVMEWLNEWIPVGTRLHHHHQVATRNPCFFRRVDRVDGQNWALVDMVNACVHLNIFEYENLQYTVANSNV